ncbi:cation-transporting ATPase [Microbacterium sp. ISL-103]|uniref:cation-transporting ATPase n=1 Tax=Microbacterium sp. ISL-103 TaxID=2819156 RepID=UPI001BEB6D6B|nr:cation-transporting ATPase [Microbacterium sp. ISL-103]MBT2473209.1 cation-transporting ATPase [Microbacterium sp. ISL-103]
MGKLTRLIGMAARALDLDESGSRTGRSGSQAGSTPPAPERRPSAHDRYAPPPAAGQSGHDPYAPPPAGRAPADRPRVGGAKAASDADRAAIARYDYLLETADPHRVEQIHREAFARLTPAQRAQVHERMTAELAPGERPASSSPDDLARAAGRSEASRPGRMRGLLSRVRGFGAAGAVGGAAVGALGIVAVGAVGSAVAAPLLEQAAGLGVDFDALAQGIDVEAIPSGLGGEELAGAAGGVLGSAGETVSGLGDTASEWGQRLGDLGIPGIGDLFGR